MMQSLTQTCYLTCGKSRGHTIFFASLKLVDQVFPLGRSSYQNVLFSSKHVSVILCFTFISRAMSATLRRVSSGLHPSYNGVTASISRSFNLTLSRVAALALLLAWFRSNY